MNPLTIESNISMKSSLEASELVLNPDGSVYHIALKNEDIADHVILVGDPGRVAEVASFFDEIELERSHREFNTITGRFKDKRVTALSTGIGTDNIDIVVNELDAAVNIDLEKRVRKENRRSLNLIRLGTCGALHEDLPVDSFIATKYALGFDGLPYYYKSSFNETEQRMADAFKKDCKWPDELAKPYIKSASKVLSNKLAFDLKQSITATATGFYGPQGRSLNLEKSIGDMHESFRSFNHDGERILNFEMESSALYALASELGHHALTICTVVANRSIMEFSKDYKSAVRKMIFQSLERLTND